MGKRREKGKEEREDEEIEGTLERRRMFSFKGGKDNIIQASLESKSVFSITLCTEQHNPALHVHV